MTSTLTEAPQAPAVPLITVPVLLNVAVDADGRGLNWDGYEPGHALRHVADISVPMTGHVQDMLEEVYIALNIGNGTPDAEAYRDRGNRSLSVGDVVILDGVAFAVGACGFDRAEVPTDSVSRTGRGRCAVGIDEAL